MRTFYLILILILISSTNEEPLNITIEAKTGIINKKLDSSKTKFSFEINCEVNKNITNNISKIDVIISIKKPNDNKQYDSLCHLVPVRFYEEETALTNFLCIIEFDKRSDLDGETNLIIENIQINNTSDFSDLAIFNFEKFDKISEAINIGDLTLVYLEEDYCRNNNFLFEMNGKIGTYPLLATICAVSLENDESHKIAKCAIPVTGDTIKCFVDVSETKYVKNNNIIIKAQDLVPCENGQNLKIVNDASNILVIKKECGELVNNNNQGLFLNKLFFLFLSIILF